jgi:tape measure domain-containing protein
MAKGSGPIQYNDLFANDVQAKLAELNSLATTLDYSFQELAKSITGMSGRVNVQIKSNASTLHEMANNLQAVDVAARGANTTLTEFAKDTETATTKGRALKDQQDGLNKVFNISTASVDQIKAQIKLLTAEYTALGRVTDADKAKLQSLATQVQALKGQQEQLTGALNKTKTAIVAADGSYNQLSQRLIAAKKELLAMPNAVDRATGALNKNNKAAVMLQREINTLDTSVKKFDATLGVHGRKVGNYTGAIGGAVNQLAQFALGYLSIQAAMQAVTKTFDLALQTGQTRTALEFIFQSTEIADQKLQMLEKTAERLGVNFLLLTSSYKSFIGAAMASKFPLTQAEKIFDAVANAGAKMQLSSDQMSGALLAIQQMISKGNVQAEELRGQLGERLPGAFAIAARAMGVTERKLNDMLKKGEVLAADLLPKLANELNKTFDNDKSKRVETLAGAVERLSNVFSTLVSKNSNISTFFKGIIDGLTGVTDSLLKLVNSSSWKEFLLRTGALFQGGAYSNMGGVADMQKIATSGGMSNQNRAGLVERFVGMQKSDQSALIQSAQTVRDNAFARMQKTGAIDDKLFFVEQSKTLLALKKSWDELYNAKVQAVEGKPEKKKKELNNLEKLEQKIKDITTAMQLAFLANPDFEMSAQTRALLDDLNEKLRYAQSLGRDDFGDLKAKTDGRSGINKSSSLMGYTVDEFASQPQVQTQAKFQKTPAQLAEELKAALDNVIPSLRENNELIGELFGQEFGTLFDDLTTNLENFLNGSGNAFEDWANTGKAAIGAIDEAYRQGTEVRIQALELEKQAQIDIAGTNAVARLAIEKEYNDKIRAEKKKQAQIDKVAAVFEIAINTAVAVSKTLAETALFGIPLIPLIVALGAAQIAAVVARPIPGFKHGTQNAPEGFAEVAEDGAEAIEGKRGLRIAHKRQITYLERGDKVFTAEQTRKMMDTQLIDSNTELHGRLSQNIRAQGERQRIKEMSIAFRSNPEEIGNAVGKQIKGLPIHQTYFDERGVSNFIRKGNTTTKILNDRMSLR